MYYESYRKASELADMIRAGTYTPRGKRTMKEETSSSFFNKKPKDVPTETNSELDNLAEMIAIMRGQQEKDAAVIKSEQSKSGSALGTDVGKRLVADLMRDFNLTKGAAAGIVGSLHHETGGFKHMQEIKPVVPGSRGGYGFAQWTGPRRVEFESWSEAEGLDINSYEANYGNLVRELRDTPEGKVLEKLSGIDDPGQAAKVFTSTFLRPGVPAIGSRVASAYSYMKEELDV